MSSLKQLGDINFKKNNLDKAIEYYTWALERPPPNETLTKEQRRAILANRAQAAIKACRIYSALQDCNTALSPEFTDESSPKALTAKLHYRRASLQYKFVEFEAALRDYQQFERLQREAGARFADSDRQLLADIMVALSYPEDSREMHKVKLLQAVQARGILVSDNARVNFPKLHTNDDDDDLEYEILDFEPVDYRLPIDPVSTPLKFLVQFNVPGLAYPDAPSRKFTITTSILEDEPIATALYGSFSELGIQMGASRDWLNKARKLESLTRSSIVLLTEAARFYVIPPNATIRDVYEGVKWPRDDPLPFRDLSTRPRKRPGAVDGLQLCEGYTLMFTVLGDDEAAEFVKKVEGLNLEPRV